MFHYTPLDYDLGTEYRNRKMVRAAKARSVQFARFERKLPTRTIQSIENREDDTILQVVTPKWVLKPQT